MCAHTTGGGVVLPILFPDGLLPYHARPAVVCYRNNNVTTTHALQLAPQRRGRQGSRFLGMLGMLMMTLVVMRRVVEAPGERLPRRKKTTARRGRAAKQKKKATTAADLAPCRKRNGL